MKATEAQKRASQKWNADKVDRLTIRVKKGMRDTLQAHAGGLGETVNAFVVRAIAETMERDNAGKG